MSERGSFVTEYIYCKACLEAAKKVLIEECLDTYQLPNQPIIAGRLKGMYPGEELHQFEFGHVERLEETICHEMRIAVLAETGSRIFTIKPEPEVQI